MQRMLVGLLVFLTAVVGVLAVMLFQLQDRVDTQSRSRPQAGSPRNPAPQGVDPAQVAKLERRVSGLLRQIEDLRAQHKQTVLALAKGSKPAAKEEGPGEPRLPKLAERLANVERRADDIAVTEQDEAFYLAVKEAVERKRRIRASFESTMRRYDRLVANGTLQAIPDEDRKRVDAAVLKYVVASDSVLTRYFRNPNEQVKALPVSDRRDAVKAERDQITAQAQTDLEGVLGAEQAQAVVDKMLKSVRRLRPGVDASGRRRNR